MEQNSNSSIAKARLTSSSETLPALADARAIVAVRTGAVKYPRYRNMPAGMRQEWLAVEFRKYMALARVKEVGTREIVVSAVALDEMMMQEPAIADLTQPEIEQAFKNGVFGKYGEYYGLTAMSLYGFLEAYLDSDIKKEATRRIREKAVAERERILAEQRDAEVAKIKAELAEAKRNGFVPTWGPGHDFTPKRVDDLLDSSAHRDKVRRQVSEFFSRDAEK